LPSIPPERVRGVDRVLPPASAEPAAPRSRNRERAMFNVCSTCGEYAAEKAIAPSGAAAFAV
jgi:hypothetical protein